MILVPVTLAEAKLFVGLHHRHNLPPVGWKWGVGLETGGHLVGVGVAAHAQARKLDDRYTIEFTRVCVIDTPNGNSKIYGALCRAATALGYRKAITYTLAAESGSSLKAVGFTIAAQLEPSRGWDQPSRHRYEQDLFGNDRTPPGPKIRWERTLAAA